MRVLVVGSGGREHALAWKISQSKKVDKIFCAPGNGGTGEIAENVNIKPDDIEALLKFAKSRDIELTIAGPEVSLVAGIVDMFAGQGLKVFGPDKDLAMLEGSKVFSKKTMRRFNVPTADFMVFSDAGRAKEYLRKKGAPIVIKADGLTAGKGVIVASTVKEAEDAVDLMLLRRAFGNAGRRIVIEDCLEGEEASILVFTDGKTIVPLASSQDHKRIFDNDEGPNTGGMGAYSPAPVVSEDLLSDIIAKVFRPIIKGLSGDGKIYRGVLYGGLMITEKGPIVLEFNVRFGDPETQAILPRLKSDLVDIAFACIEGRLDKMRIEWDDRQCLCVVTASRGYPGPYERDKEIKGLEDAKITRDLIIFHAGTSLKKGKIVTSGGRVLGVAGLGKDIMSARKKAYEGIERINFDGMHYRKDIGDKAIKR